MELISLSEFLRLTLLKAEQVLSMLDRGELRAEIGTAGQVLVDISSLSPEILSRRDERNPLGISDEELEHTEEIIASEILEVIDDLLDESLSLALKWQSERGGEAGEDEAE